MAMNRLKFQAAVSMPEFGVGGRGSPNKGPMVAALLAAPQGSLSGRRLVTIWRNVRRREQQLVAEVGCQVCEYISR